MAQAVAPGMKAQRYGRIDQHLERRRARHQPDRHPGLCERQGRADRPDPPARARARAVRNITVNNVAPGFVRSNPTTERQWEAMGEEGQERLIQNIALKRLGSPDDIAAMVMFFASDYAGWITGQVLSVDGGK